MGGRREAVGVGVREGRSGAAGGDISAVFAAIMSQGIDHDFKCETRDRKIIVAM